MEERGVKMMALYKMELRKIWSRKITVVSAVLLFSLTLVYLMILISGERSIEKGTPYRGIGCIREFWTMINSKTF